jgi:cell shape-determining protein MreD
VLLAVVAIGLTGGSKTGIIAGFCAGLALDLAPPANELIGQYALVFCLVGYFCGRLTFTLRRSAVLALAAAAAIGAAAELLAAGLVLVLDTPQVTLATVAQVLPSSVLYDVLLSPLVLFVAVRIAVALGVSFNPLDDSPALERGGSARPLGLAGLTALRRTPNTAGGSDGLGVGSGGWLTGDSVAGVAAVGAVGWLSGPATTRRQRREQARLTAALTGAAPRKGAFWVGNRPAQLGQTGSAASTTAPSSGLSRLRPEAGVAGSATREGLPGPALPVRPVKVSFGSGRRRWSGGQIGGSAGVAGTGRPPADGDNAGSLSRGPVGSRSVPKIAFGGSSPRSGLGGAGLGGAGLGGAGLGGAGSGGAASIDFGGSGSDLGRADGQAGRIGQRRTPRIAFGTGGLAGAGRARGRGVPRIAFKSGLPGGQRLSPGRPARPRFRSSRSASGSWLAGSRFRSAGLGSSASYGLRRARWTKTAKLRRKRQAIGWLAWLRRPRRRQLGR